MVLGFGCFLILAAGYHRGYISIVGNEIGNPAFYLIMLVAGWGWLYCIAVFLKKHDFKVNRIIACISQKSATIIALHFLAFKLVNAIAVLIYGMEPYMTAAFPVLMNYWFMVVDICHFRHMPSAAFTGCFVHPENWCINVAFILDIK